MCRSVKYPAQVTNNLEWYSPEAITTEDGSLVVTLSQTQTHNLNYQGGVLTQLTTIAWYSDLMNLRYDVDMVCQPLARHSKTNLSLGINFALLADILRQTCRFLESTTLSVSWLSQQNDAEKYDASTGFWPAIWTLGNLGRAGYGASLEGMVRHYHYGACSSFNLQSVAIYL